DGGNAPVWIDQAVGPHERSQRAHLHCLNTILGRPRCCGLVSLCRLSHGAHRVISIPDELKNSSLQLCTGGRSNLWSELERLLQYLNSIAVREPPPCIFCCHHKVTYGGV